VLYRSFYLTLAFDYEYERKRKGIWVWRGTNDYAIEKLVK